MDVRRAIGGIGRTFIATGVLILLFVAYQLWGTGLAEARSQDELTDQFRRALPTTTTTTAAPGAVTTPGPTATSVAPAPPPPTGPTPVGEAVAIIRIPRIDVEKAVVQGVGLEDLKKGPGHYPSTPMPGEAGNAAIAGHRTTYGAPFFRLNELAPGDPILVTTRDGEFRYTVRTSKVVRPDETSVLDPTTEGQLTLTTCNPRFSASQRLVVIASLQGREGGTPPPVTAPPGTVPPPAAPPPALPPPPPAPPSGPGAGQAGAPGLSGRNAANGPAVAWGSLAAAIWFLTWVLSRRWGRVPAYVVGTPVFLVVLFVFFENFSRLLPSNF